MSRGWRWVHYYIGCAAMYVPLMLFTDLPLAVVVVISIAFGFAWEWQAVDINKRLKARNERILRERETRRDHS